MMSSQTWAMCMVFSIISMSAGLLMGSFMSMAVEPWGTLIWITTVGGGAIACHGILAAVTGNVMDR